MHVCLSVGVHMCVSKLECMHVHLGHTPWLYVLYMWAWGRVCICWYLRVWVCLCGLVCECMHVFMFGVYLYVYIHIVYI